MKMFKTLATGAALLSIASMANAGTIFHITGSTAFRAATITAIQFEINGSATITPTAADNATATSANNLLWTGSNGTLGNYTIKASFNGSGAGTQLVAGALAIPFLDGTNTGWPTTIAGTPTTANSTDVVVPDVAMSDVFQSTSGFLGNVPTDLPLGTGTVPVAHTYSHLTDNQVAIVTFKPMASKTFPQGTAAGLVDDTGSFNVSSYSMTTQNFRATWSNGSTLLSLYTGNNSDENSVVWATGRNQDSGTRLTYLSETTFGVNNFVNQYYPTYTSGTVTAVNQYSIQTINGISTQQLGNSGESSGGTVRGYLQQPFASDLASLGGNGYFVTVLGTSDSLSVNTSAIELPYNGTYYSNTAVEEGTYTMWGYEHMFYLPGLSNSGADTNALSFANSVKSHFTGVAESGLSHAGLPLGVMNVSRSNDGLTVTSQNY